MIDHVSIGVRDLRRAARFYEAVLGAIGYAALEVARITVGFGKKYPEFWINLRAGDAACRRRTRASHVALRVRSTELVDAFHAAALAAGGASDGAPGLRPQHGEGLLRRLHPRPGRQPHRGGDVLASRCVIVGTETDRCASVCLQR